MSFASHGFGYRCVQARRGALLALGILLATNLFATADDLVGQASIIDGDTLEIHGKRIRLWGIDAPKSSQLCRDKDSLLYQCGAEGEQFRWLHCEAIGELQSNLDGRIRARCGIMFGWRDGSRRLACQQRARAELAPVFERKIRQDTARS